jgi:hypothetical protein
MPELVLEDDYVVGAEFLAIEQACALPLNPVERLFLDVLRRTTR